jgi:ABC-2 type transport system ATP-binding protein
MSILISSHLLAEVEKMVSHIGIIYKGQMLFQGPLTELHQIQQKGAKLFIKTSDNELAIKLLEEYHPEREKEKLSIVFKDNSQVAAINRKLTQNNLDVFLLHPKENDLEQLFIDLTSAQS